MVFHGTILVFHRAERRRREARHETYITPKLVTTRRSILGPPAEGRPGPSDDNYDDDDDSDDDDGDFLGLLQPLSLFFRLLCLLVRLLCTEPLFLLPLLLCQTHLEKYLTGAS